MRTHKRCPTCNRLLPWEAFNKDMSQSTGIRCTCRECTNSRRRTKWEQHTEAQRLARNQRNAAYRERKRETAWGEVVGFTTSPHVDQQPRGEQA